jgi:hypothetical protein
MIQLRARRSGSENNARYATGSHFESMGAAELPTPFGELSAQVRLSRDPHTVET